MKRMTVFCSVVLSALFMVPCNMHGMHKAPVVSVGNLSWTDREIICIGAACCIGIGAMLYIGRLESRIDGQSKRIFHQYERIDEQDRLIKQQNYRLNRQTEGIQQLRRQKMIQDISIDDLKESGQSHHERLTMIEQWKAQKSQEDIFLSFHHSSSCSDSE